MNNIGMFSKVNSEYRANFGRLEFYDLKGIIAGKVSFIDTSEFIDIVDIKNFKEKKGVEKAMIDVLRKLFSEMEIHGIMSEVSEEVLQSRGVSADATADRFSFKSFCEELVSRNQLMVIN